MTFESISTTFCSQMTPEVPRQAIAAFKINCIGAEPAQRIRFVEASVTVNNDESREVGCPYIGRSGDRRGKCRNEQTPQDNNCIHLFPNTI